MHCFSTTVWEISAVRRSQKFITTMFDWFPNSFSRLFREMFPILRLTAYDEEGVS